jgi:hypothetical protein
VLEEYTIDWEALHLHKLPEAFELQNAHFLPQVVTPSEQEWLRSIFNTVPTRVTFVDEHSSNDESSNEESDFGYSDPDESEKEEEDNENHCYYDKEYEETDGEEDEEIDDDEE